MALLGQTGSDTITHIVSLVTLLALGIAVPLIFVMGHVTLDTTAIAFITAFETVDVLMMGYYSVKYQQTPTGGVIISTDANSVNPPKSP